MQNTEYLFDWSRRRNRMNAGPVGHACDDVEKLASTKISRREVQPFSG
jgi:hypothetical protein